MPEALRAPCLIPSTTINQCWEVLWWILPIPIPSPPLPLLSPINEYYKNKRISKLHGQGDDAMGAALAKSTSNVLVLFPLSLLWLRITQDLTPQSRKKYSYIGILNRMPGVMTKSIYIYISPNFKNGIFNLTDLEVYTWSTKLV